MIDLEYLGKMAGTEQADAPAFEELIDAHRAFVTPRPIAEYHEDMGPVLWWCIVDGVLAGEPPYVGTPNDLGCEVVIEMPTVGHCTARVDRDFSPNAMELKRITFPGGTFFVSGWPGYHTHFTPIPMPTVKPKP